MEGEGGSLATLRENILEEGVILGIIQNQHFGFDVVASIRGESKGVGGDNFWVTIPKE